MRVIDPIGVDIQYIIEDIAEAANKKRGQHGGDIGSGFITDGQKVLPHPNAYGSDCAIVGSDQPKIRDDLMHEVKLGKELSRQQVKIMSPTPDAVYRH